MGNTRAELHNAVDIVLAEYLQANPGSLPSQTSVMQLLDWHYQKMRTEPSQIWSDPDSKPIPMILHCPMCHARHIDQGEFAKKPHHAHACQECGHVWRPALVPTVGVLALPGFLDDHQPRPIAKNVVLFCTPNGWTVHRVRHVESHAADAADASSQHAVTLLVSWKIGGGPFDDVDGAVAAYLAEVLKEAKEEGRST